MSKYPDPRDDPGVIDPPPTKSGSRKFEPQHITQFLTDTHQLRSTDRWFRLTYTIIGVAVFGGLSWFILPEWSDLYFDILMFLGVFTAGGAGGYGLKSWQNQRRS